MRLCSLLQLVWNWNHVKSGKLREERQIPDEFTHLWYIEKTSKRISFDQWHPLGLWLQNQHYQVWGNEQSIGRLKRHLKVVEDH